MELLTESNRHFLLTPQIIVDELENMYYEPMYYSGATEVRLENFRFFCAKEQLYQDVLYLFSPDEKPDRELLTYIKALVYIGTAPKAALEIGVTVILMPKGTDLLSLANDLSDIFLKYHLWDIAISQAAKKGDIVELAKQGKKIFRNPLFIHDNRYNYIINQSWSGDSARTTVNLRTGLTIIAPEQLQSMLDSKAYQKTIGTHHARLYEDFPRVANRIIYVNLWNSEDHFVGRVCINEIASPFFPGQFYTADYYAEWVLIALENSRLTLNNNYNIVKSYFAVILSNEPLDKAEFEGAIECIDMHPSDQYLAAWMAISDFKYQNLNAAGICYEIEERFPNSCAFPYQEGVGIVINQTLMTFEENKIRDLFQEIAAIYPVQTGLSTSFSNIYELPDYMQQAFQTLTVADRIKNEQVSKSICIFSDYALHNMLLYGCERIPRKCILSPALNILRNYDHQNHTDFFRSLQTFLECNGNVAEAAKILFVHRSTMNYRLSKIEKLTGIDLTDYHARLYLSMSFLIDQETE